MVLNDLICVWLIYCCVNGEASILHQEENHVPVLSAFSMFAWTDPQG